MSDKVVLHEIVPSPNNIKVRIALNFKEIPFERRPIEMQPGVPISQWKRDAVLAATEQPFTPALEHGDNRMFDSSSILRYLEANFPKTRRLFSRDYNQMRAIENWEAFGKREAAEVVSILFNQANSPGTDSSEIKRANDLYENLTGKIEAQLVKTRFLAGDDLSAADVVVAPYVSYGGLTEERAKSSPIAQFFHQNLKMPAGREKTHDWIGRVLSHDR